MRSCIDVVCPCYSNFSIGITLLHHNGTTVHGREEIQQLRFTCSAHSYDNLVHCMVGTCLSQCRKSGYQRYFRRSGYGSGQVCNLLQLRHLSVSCRPVINSESKHQCVSKEGCTSTLKHYLCFLFQQISTQIDTSRITVQSRVVLINVPTTALARYSEFIT